MSPRMFRLVDLVVLAFIVGTIGLICVPAVFRVREEAHRVGCNDNLRAIAVACHNYHSDKGKLPPGWLGPNPPGANASSSPNVGMLALLLPYGSRTGSIDSSGISAS